MKSESKKDINPVEVFFSYTIGCGFVSGIAASFIRLIHGVLGGSYYISLLYLGELYLSPFRILLLGFKISALSALAALVIKKVFRSGRIYIVSAAILLLAVLSLILISSPSIVEGIVLTMILLIYFFANAAVMNELAAGVVVEDSSLD